MVIHVEAWVRRHRIGNREKVTEGRFKFVALDDAFHNLDADHGG